MRKHPPRLADPKGREAYLETHLFNELCWLLYAATEWSIQSQLNLQIDGYQVQVFAMDSACLHARSLFEFFTHATTDNYYGCSEFIGSTLTSVPYSGWRDSLHKFLMHASDRSAPTSLDSNGAKKGLNQMPVDFAFEVLRLWKEFEERLGASGKPGDKELGELAHSKRKEAIANATHVINSRVAKQHAGEKGQTLLPVFTFSI